MIGTHWWWNGVREPERLSALERSGLFETGPEDAFDRLTELAVAVTGATIACITFVDAACFAYKSTVGVAEGATQSGPVEASFCRYVVGSGKPFIVDDARNDFRTLDNPAIAIHGISAWAGYPIEDDEGWVLGTICLVAAEPYVWTGTDLHVLATLAQAVSSEIALRHARTVIATMRTAAAQSPTNDIDLTGTQLRTTADAHGRPPIGRTTRARTLPSP